MEKVPPSERLSKEIEQALSGLGREEGDLLEVLIEKSVRVVMQRIVEQEVTDYLGREYFERNAESPRGYRNGYEPKKLKTAEGKVALEVPQVRGSEQTYKSEFLKNLAGLSPGLRRLAVEM